MIKDMFDKFPFGRIDEWDFLLLMPKVNGVIPHDKFDLVLVSSDLQTRFCCIAHLDCVPHHYTSIRRGLYFAGYSLLSIRTTDDKWTSEEEYAEYIKTKPCKFCGAS